MERDQQLILEVVKNNEDAFRELLSLYRNMIYKVANSFNLEHGDYLIDIDSLFQEGSIVLYNTCFTYEIDKGVKFSTYFYSVLRLRFISYINKNYANEKSHVLSIDNIENIDYRLAMSNMCVAEDPVAYHRELEFEEDINNFVRSLNDVDRKIVSYKSAGLTYKDIANKLNISTKNIDNRLRLIKKRLRRYLNRNNE